MSKEITLEEARRNIKPNYPCSHTELMKSHEIVDKIIEHYNKIMSAGSDEAIDKIKCLTGKQKFPIQPLRHEIIVEYGEYVYNYLFKAQAKEQELAELKEKELVKNNIILNLLDTFKETNGIQDHYIEQLKELCKEE